MVKKLTQRERLARTVAGKAVDRPAVALWRHFYLAEVSREGLVEAMAGWQKTHDWDFLKINPRASYHVEDWGNRYESSGNEHIEPTLVRHRVREPDDFRRLDPLDVDGGSQQACPVLSDHLQAVADLRRAVGRDVPMLMTVFTPMGIAAELAGGPQDLAALIAQDPASVHVGLQTITKTFAGFAARCVEAGADGIFLATTHCATRTNFTAAQYAEFGRPYDLEILRAVRKAPLNLLHVCRPHSMVRDLADYPVAMLNWDTADPSNPDLAALAPAVRPRRACRARAAGRKALVGGLNRKYFSETGGRETLLAEAEAARRAMGKRPFVLGATCTIDPTSDPDTVMAIRKSVGP